MEIRTSVISVGDIDTVGQQFKCDFYLSATWQEPQLRGKSPAEVRPQCSHCLIILTAWIFFTFFFFDKLDAKPFKPEDEIWE